MSIFNPDIITSKLELEEYQEKSIRFLKKRLESPQEQMYLYNYEFGKLSNYINEIYHNKANLNYLNKFGLSDCHVSIQQIASLEDVNPKVLCTELVQIINTSRWITIYHIAFTYDRFLNYKERTDGQVLSINWLS